MTQRTPSKWVKLFSQFVQDARIASKEIVAEDERGVRLVMWDSQRRFLENVAEGLDDGVRIFYCLKSRQVGVTTISLLIDVFWLAMHRDLTMALVTDVEKNRDANRETIRRYVNSFPDEYFGSGFKVVKDNRSFMTFSNGSRIDFLVAGTTSKTISWAEGVGYAAAHLTEVAKYGSSQALASFEESFSQQNPNRLYIYESTAKGFNHWHERYYKGKQDQSVYRSFFIGWWAGDTNRIYRNDPRYPNFSEGKPSGEEREKIGQVAYQYGVRIDDEQLAWVRWKEMNSGSEEDILQQNQPWTERDAFITSGYSFFQNREISKDIKHMMDKEHPDYSGFAFRLYRYHVADSFFDMSIEQLWPDPTKPGDDVYRFADLRVWEEPAEGGRYVIGMDTAYGRNDHADKNAISVWRCFADKLVQVAEYATADHDVRQATWVLAHLAGAYSDCLINHEVNGPGGMVITELDHLRATMNADMNEKIMKSKDWENALTNARWYLYHRPDSMGAGYAIGFMTSFNNKMQLIFNYRSAYVSHELKIKSLGLLKEMSYVVQDGSEIGAPESNSPNSKDDRVFAAALAHKAWHDWIKRDMIAKGQTYERIVDDEQGKSSPINRSLNNQVARFFMTMEEKAKLLPAPATWREQRNLL
jgi:hypothetical protein